MWHGDGDQYVSNVIAVVGVPRLGLIIHLSGFSMRSLYFDIHQNGVAMND